MVAEATWSFFMVICDCLSFLAFYSTANSASLRALTPQQDHAFAYVS